VAKQIKDAGLQPLAVPKGKPEDTEMRSATRVIQVRGVVGSTS
jgi:hypothetical protein